MTDRRLQLQTLLEGLGTEDAPLKVYYQPPAGLKMEYPCVVYSRDTSNTKFAGNFPYRRVKRYLVTVMDRDPDSIFPDKIEALPLCSMNRTFVAENLNHFVFSLYY